mgnify:CR=1 FL=1|jgi:hypothetical protein
MLPGMTRSEGDLGLTLCMWFVAPEPTVDCDER